MKSFLTWIENEESASLGEPQHKKGESNMSLDKIVEKRVKAMIMDLESSGKGTQNEILGSVVKYAEKMGAGKKEEPVQQQGQPMDNQSLQGADQNQPANLPNMQ